MGSQAENRDYGIDCVKVIAVVFVILHHVVDCGLTMSDTAGGALKTVWYLTHTVALTCVNLFALVTGYLCVTSNGAHRRLLTLWIQTLSIGLLISAAVAFAGGRVGIWDWVRSILPVVTGEYWYFTAYVVLCLLMPFVNPGARSLGRKTFAGLLIAFFLLMSVSSLFTEGDPFVLKNGYSFAWLLVVYLFGAYWRLHVAKPPPLAACAAVLCTFSFAFMIPSVGKRVFSGELGTWFADFNPVRYTSPFTFAMSLAMFGACKRITVKNRIVRLALVSASKKSLGIYLWLVHPVFWHSFWRPQLGTIVVDGIGMFTIYTTLITLCSFASAWLLESARQRLFDGVGRICRATTRTANNNRTAP